MKDSYVDDGDGTLRTMGGRPVSVASTDFYVGHGRLLIKQEGHAGAAAPMRMVALPTADRGSESTGLRRSRSRARRLALDGGLTYDYEYDYDDAAGASGVGNNGTRS